jgi:hypothetical protein
MSIQKGQQAPDFSLFNTEKQKVTLSEFKGKNVVIFVIILLYIIMQTQLYWVFQLIHFLH